VIRNGKLHGDLRQACSSPAAAAPHRIWGLLRHEPGALLLPSPSRFGLLLTQPGRHAKQDVRRRLARASAAAAAAMAAPSGGKPPPAAPAGRPASSAAPPALVAGGRGA
jgi:hypothetical protein